MSIRIRGISYFFQIHQEKKELPNLVLLHGFLGSSEVFNHLIKDLKSFCNPITIDLLGHGKTEGAELYYRFSTKEQIADLSKLIGEQFEIPLYLFGYSMGARLALQLALQKPNLLRGLVLESGTFGLEEDTERQVRQALDAGRADQIMGNFSSFLSDWKLKPLFHSSHSEKKSSTIELVQSSQNSTWMANSLLGFGTGTMPCVKDRLADLVSPIQLIVGEKDSKFTRINHAMKSKLPNANLAIVKGANHRVHIDQPDEWMKIIETFLIGNKIS